MSRYILNEVETRHHLILIRLYFILTTLITEDDHANARHFGTGTIWHLCETFRHQDISAPGQSGIEYIVTGDSVYNSDSLPLVEVVYKLYSANVNIQNVN